VNVLDALGPIPSTLITLDFESFYSSEFSLSRLTTESYVRDSRFETIGVGVKVDGNPAVWMEHGDFIAWGKSVPWQNVAVLAHHAHFDGLVLAHRYGIRPGFWFDTLSMSRAIHGPGVDHSLAGLAIRYGIGVKGRELENTRGKRRRDFTPAEWLAFGVYCNNDVELEHALFKRMLPGFPVEELWLIDTTVRMFTEPRFVGNQGALERTLVEERRRKRDILAWVAGVKIPDDTPPDAALAAALEAARSTLASSDKFAALLQTFGETPPTKPGKPAKDGTPRTIFAFAQTDPGMQALLEHENPEVVALAEARLSVKSTIVETRTERFLGMARRGLLLVYLKYAAAHTHRWGGGDKSNWQNMNRGGSLRDSVEAGEGETLVVTDSGQIEARVVAWLAGETTLLETFRRNDAQTDRYESERARLLREIDDERAIDTALIAAGIQAGDFYSDVGEAFFRRKLSKRETPRERQISKALTLGLGFQMGWGKCSTELLKGMLGTPPVQFTNDDARFFGVDVHGFAERPHGMNGPPCGGKVKDLITLGARVPYGELLVHCAVTAHLVGVYRATNRKIAALWKTMEGIIRVMEEPGGDPHAVRAVVGPMRVIRHGIIKPNGLSLHYPGLRRTADGYVYQGGKSGREVVKIYGGSLTENVVQSLARDVVAEQALWVRAGGLHLATTTHDELVVVTDEAEGERALTFMLAAMKRPPEWCRDLPLNASGAVAKSYGAAK
jgi:DNA polymerase